jgi:TonB family protein
MPLKCRVAIAGLAAATLATTAATSETAKTETEPQLLNLPEVVTADDYPRGALAQQEQGAADIRLTVDPAGRVSACKVEKSSGSASLDATSCRVYSERARYEPATASDKKRVVRTRVTWRLGSLALSRRGWFQRTTMTIKADGSVVSCRLESSEAPDTDCWLPAAFPAAAAANFVKQAGYDPVRFVTEIRFYPDGAVPEDTIRFPLLSRRSARIGVSKDGTMRSCEVIEDGGSPEARESVCREARQYRFEAITGSSKSKGTVYFWSYFEPTPGS